MSLKVGLNRFSFIVFFDTIICMIENLNPQQLHAVQYCKGPLLVIAGAGSGKTKMLTTKIAYLIREMSIPSAQILAVTFTNKAAKEMLHRVQTILTSQNISLKAIEMPIITTFHSFAVRFLRREIYHIGFDRSFNILDMDDALVLIKESMQYLNIDTKVVAPKNVQSHISFLKNKFIKADDFAFQNSNSYFYKEATRVFAHYQQRLKELNSCDFDDLILHTLDILQNFPEVRQKYRDYFKYILVDEYQDTNKPQYLIIKHLVSNNGNICVVGDDDQSIYRFRGADVSNILDFEKDYENTYIVKLEQNYRSTQNILDVAHSVISHNSYRRAKKLWTSKINDHKIKVFNTINEREESNKVCEEIKHILREGNYKAKNIAILYRINAQSRVIEEGMLKYSLPYKIVGGLKFYERKEIKDVIAYLKIVFNPNDDLSLKRIINTPARGISKEFIHDIFSSDNISVNDEALHWMHKYNLNKTSLFYKIFLFAFNNDISVSRKKALLEFLELYKVIHDKSFILSVSDLIDYILTHTQYKTKVLDNEADGESRWENIEEIITVAQKYDIEDFKTQDSNVFRKHLEDFLTEVSLITDMDNKNFDEDSITLMTVHSAKGLEFDVVFVVGLEENIFPSYMSASDPLGIEEERRLMYVAVTRARDILYLSYASTRTFMGMTKSNKISRFVADIPQEYLEYLEVSDKDYFNSDISISAINKSKSISYPSSQGKSSLKDRFAKNMDFKKTNVSSGSYKVGDKMNHKKFGTGIVVYVSGDIIKVDFDNVGVKTLLASVINRD